MGFVLNTLFITTITVLIVDVSGFIENLKRLIFRWLNGKGVKYRDFNLKPLDCSFCFAFWVNLIFLVVSGFSIWGLLLILIWSWMTTYIRELFLLLDSWLIKLFEILTPKN